MWKVKPVSRSHHTRKAILEFASKIILIRVRESLLCDWPVLIQILISIGVTQSESGKYNRIIDLDVDIGAEAVDYK
jgi:hypothetical protein